MAKEHQFKPGQSGNPKGRPKKIVTSADLRKRLTDDMPTILNMLIVKAKEGDIQAIKIILDRTHPPLKAQALPVQIPLGETLSETGGNVVAETLKGQIPPDIGSQLITALTNQGKLIELQEMNERLTRIEKQLDQRK